MAITTVKTISHTWQKVSDSNCILQSVQQSIELYQIHIGDAAPTDDEACLTTLLSEPATISLDTAVWVRVQSSEAPAKLVVIE